MCCYDIGEKGSEEGILAYHFVSYGYKAVSLDNSRAVFLYNSRAAQGSIDLILLNFPRS